MLEGFAQLHESIDDLSSRVNKAGAGSSGSNDDTAALKEIQSLQNSIAQMQRTLSVSTSHPPPAQPTVCAR